MVKKKRCYPSTVKVLSVVCGGVLTLALSLSATTALWHDTATVPLPLLSGHLDLNPDGAQISIASGRVTSVASWSVVGMGTNLATAPISPNPIPTYGGSFSNALTADTPVVTFSNVLGSNYQTIYSWALVSTPIQDLENRLLTVVWQSGVRQNREGDNWDADAEQQVAVHTVMSAFRAGLTSDAVWWLGAGRANPPDVLDVQIPTEVLTQIDNTGTATLPIYLEYVSESDSAEWSLVGIFTPIGDKASSLIQNTTVSASIGNCQSNPPPPLPAATEPLLAATDSWDPRGSQTSISPVEGVDFERTYTGFSQIVCLTFFRPATTTFSDVVTVVAQVDEGTITQSASWSGLEQPQVSDGMQNIVRFVRTTDELRFGR